MHRRRNYFGILEEDDDESSSSSLATSPKNHCEGDELKDDCSSSRTSTKTKGAQPKQSLSSLEKEINIIISPSTSFPPPQKLNIRKMKMKSKKFKTLSSYQQKLFNELELLVEESSSLLTKKKKRGFYSKDFSFQNSTYRIYNYQALTKPSQFAKPSGLECRGHMFEIDLSTKEPIRFVCLPPPKFFNINENTMASNLNFTNPKQVMMKEDGSLISTFLHYDDEGEEELYVKSKGCLDSQQAMDSMEFLNRSENRAFKAELKMLEMLGYTINLEYVGPRNCVVLPYSKDRLIVLSIRNRGNGNLLHKDDLDSKKYPEMNIRWVKQLDVSKLDMDKFIRSYRLEKDIEGYVIQLASGQYVKAKTMYYVGLSQSHQTKDDAKKLYMNVLNDKTDDLKSMWCHEQNFVQKIEKFEMIVMQILNESREKVEKFYESNVGVIGLYEGNKRELKAVWEELAKQSFREEWLRRIAIHRLGKCYDDDMWRGAMKKSWDQVEDHFS